MLYKKNIYFIFFNSEIILNKIGEYQKIYSIYSIFLLLIFILNIILNNIIYSTKKITD